MTDEQTGHAGRVTEILEQRAAALAQPLDESEPGDTLEVLVMTFGSEHYGLETNVATAVVIGATPTVIPGTPRSWKGIVNIRGTLYPVLDLRSHLSLQATAAPVAPVGVVLASSGAGLTIGIALEQPPELLRIPRKSLRPEAAGRASPGRRGSVLRTGTDELVTLLDLELLIADPRLTPPEARG